MEKDIEEYKAYLEKHSAGTGKVSSYLIVIKKIGSIVNKVNGYAYVPDDFSSIRNLDLLWKIYLLVKSEQEKSDGGFFKNSTLTKAYWDSRHGFCSAAVRDFLKFRIETYGGSVPQLDEVCLETCFQQIVYGAPGTGKSFGTEQEIKASGVDERKDVFRTTFHPDSDYSTFVGAYKPTKEDPDYDTIVQVNKIVRDQEGKESVQPELKAVRKSEITYDFVPQAFIRAYVAAWKKYAAKHGAPLTKQDRVYLVIEEINRGHCAQIFGDLFQLLDRNEEGFSDYPIDADADLEKWLKKEFCGLPGGQPLPGAGGSGTGGVRGAPAIPGAGGNWTGGHAGRVPLPGAGGDGTGGVRGAPALPADVLDGTKMMLPPNLFIRATMNTSDQSLFPMDSAFKRRWDWKYVPISPPDKEEEPNFNDRMIVCKWKEKDTNGNDVDVVKKFDWWKFLDEFINKKIFNTTKSEDKQLGYFFVKVPNDPGEIPSEKFAGKVLFYLYNDVFKDYNYPDEVFAKRDASGAYKSPKEKYLFKDFFDGKGNVKDQVVAEFLKNLGMTAEQE